MTREPVVNCGILNHAEEMTGGEGNHWWGLSAGVIRYSDKKPAVRASLVYMEERAKGFIRVLQYDTTIQSTRHEQA